MPSKTGEAIAGLGQALDARGAQTSENDRMRKLLDDLLAKLEEDSQRRSQQEGASQAAFADALDKRIVGDEEAEADSLYAEQYRRQLPTERQAFSMGTSNGSSRDELANYAMIQRARRSKPRDDTAGFNRDFSRAMADDTAGFNADFERNQRVNQRMQDMFGSREKVNEVEKQRILADMAKGSAAAVQSMSTAPSPPDAAFPAPATPDQAALDEAARRERGFR